MTFPAPTSDLAILAARLTAYADEWEDFVLDANWQREAWERRVAEQRDRYFDELDRRMGR